MSYFDLYQWFIQHKRDLPWRETSDPYKIWISEIILQQTRVNQGIAYYYRFVEAFETVEDLAAASEDRVLRLWQGLGYYSRARNMHKAAKMIVESGKSRVKSGESREFPKTFEEIRALPGVGDYTAGAIAAFAYNLPYPALDGNVYRVLARLTDCEMAFDTSAGKKHFHRIAEELMDKEQPRLFNSAMMELGALQCVPTHPDCETCPLRFECLALAHGTVEVLPVRKPRPVLQDRYLNYTIYIEGNEPSQWRTLIRQRTEKDIWQHLYEFVLKESDRLEEAKNAMDFTHILSHRRLHARFHIEHVQTLPEIEDTIAVKWEELEEYAMPKLMLRAIDQVER